MSESTWTLEDGELHVTLSKLEAGAPWPAAIAGHEADALTRQREQQRLLLERFQREVRSLVCCWQGVWLPFACTALLPVVLCCLPLLTRHTKHLPLPPPLRVKNRAHQQHPGFDFSQATFNGEAPDPRTFLGGIGGDALGRGG